PTSFPYTTLFRSLPLVYESDCGYSFLLKRGKQLRCHLNNGRASHGAGSSCWEIVNGDGNLTIGYSERRHGHQLKRQGQGQKCAKRKQQKLHRRNPPGTAHQWVDRDHRSNATKL